MIVSKLTKLLTVSLIGVVFSNTGFSEFLTQNAKCINPVQFFGAIGIGAQQGRVKADVNKALYELLQKQKIMSKDGKFQGINKIDKNQVKVSVGQTEVTQQAEDMKFVSKSSYMQGDLDTSWEECGLDVRPSNEVSGIQTDSNGHKYINTINKTTVIGAGNQVLPVNGDVANGISIDQNNAINVANGGDPQNKSKTITSVQKIPLSLDTSGLPQYGISSELYNVMQQWSEKNALPGSASSWNGNILIELGLRFNSSFGGSVTVGVGASLPVINKTMTLELGKDGTSSSTSENENNNNGNNNSSTGNGWQIDLTKKFALEAFVELGVPFSSQSEGFVGIGIVHEKSISNIKGNDSGSSNTENKNCFLKQKQEMIGWFPFFIAGVNYFFNKNIGIGVFCKYYCAGSLKEKDTKSSDESSKTSDTNSLPVSFTKMGGPEFGCKFLFRF